MIRRAWLLVSSAWALTFLGNGLTKVDGPGPLDVAIAVAPFLGGLALAWAARFILAGSVSRPLPVQVHRPRVVRLETLIRTDKRRFGRH